MKLVMRCGDITCIRTVDKIEREESVVFAYKKATPDALVADEFVGVFDLGSVDFLYVTEERGTE